MPSVVGDECFSITYNTLPSTPLSLLDKRTNQPTNQPTKSKRSRREDGALTDTHPLPLPSSLFRSTDPKPQRIPAQPSHPPRMANSPTQTLFPLPPSPFLPSSPFPLPFRCFCLVWFGLVWFGLVWFGLVWFAMLLGFVSGFEVWNDADRKRTACAWSVLGWLTGIVE